MTSPLRRFAPPNGFASGACWVEFAPDSTGVYVWRDGTRVSDVKMTLRRAERLTRKRTWEEIPAAGE